MRAFLLPLKWYWFIRRKKKIFSFKALLYSCGRPFPQQPFWPSASSLLWNHTCNASGSQALRNIAWPAWNSGSEAGCDRAFWWSVSRGFLGSNPNAASLNVFLSTDVCLRQHLCAPSFPHSKHSKAGADGDFKGCLTNILLARHLILISRPQAPGAKEVSFKAEHRIGIFSTPFYPSM